MSTAVNVATKDPVPPLASDAPVREWVDALANGTCSNVEFLRHFRDKVQQDADLVWEALALLDQNYRTRRIERDTYLPIKAYLERFAVAHGDSADAQPQKIVPVAKQPVTATTVSPSASVPLRIGAKLRGRYRIIGILGSSSAGTVVEAIDELRADIPGISQRIAVRVRDTRDFDQTGQLAAYLRHVCKIQAFSHPNLTRIFDFDQDQGRLLLTMELLAGSTVAQLTAETGAAQSYVLDRRHIAQCVASALHYAHAQGVAHGHLRADQVFITHSGGVRVLGLERSFDLGDDSLAKDHLDFASFAYDLLSAEPRAELLHRPSGLTDGQWHSLSAVLGGNHDEGPNLLQQFAAPMAAAALTPTATATSTAASTMTQNGADKKSALRGALWGSLAMLGILGVGYFAYDLTMREPARSALAPTPKPSAPAAAAARAAVPAANDVATTVAASPPVLAPAPVTPPIAAPSVPVSTARTSTINLQREAVEVDDRQTVARLKVQRRGSTAKAVTFVWWTETGTAQPGVDFYAVSPRSAEFPAGAASVELFVPLVPNAENQKLRTFYVKIDEAGEGAELGELTLAQVSIVPPGYVAPPEVEEPAANDTSQPATEAQSPATEVSPAAEVK